MRVMLDTNILISILLFNSQTVTKFINKISQADKYEIIISDYVIDELFAVTERKFMNRYAELRNKLNQINYTLLNTRNLNIKTRLPSIRDNKDSPILYAAMNADAAYFITGDKDFHAIKEYITRPRIITLSEFLDLPD